MVGNNTRQRMAVARLQIFEEYKIFRELSKKNPFLEAFSLWHINVLVNNKYIELNIIN